MKPTYRIKDWDDHFETAESRKLKSTRWVPMPTKHDGKGYRRITQHNEAVAIFCAWNLIVQVASKMPTRGVLADSDGPLDADDLSAKTGFPSAIFATALPFLSSESIGWMSLDQQRRARQSARVRQSPPESAEVDADSSPEGKGMEGNGIEQKGTDSAKAGAGAAPKIPRGVSTEDFTIWNLGVGKLMATGSSEHDARSFLGEQNKIYGKANVARAVTEMLAQEPAEPKGYIVTVLKNQNGPRPGMSKVDHSMAAVRQVMEEFKHGN
jgi:hypothetical protein